MSNDVYKYVSDPKRYMLASASTRDYDKSTKLWRYLTFEKFAWLLEKSTLWHTRLDHLGDPFEGSFTKAYVQKRDAGVLPGYLQTGLTPEAEKSNNKAVLYTHFATCWYAAAFESPAMWKLYSTEHAGVAVVSTPLRMYNSVDLSPYGQGILSPVEYQDFEVDDMLLQPVSKGFGRHAHPGLLKRKFFKDENEVRGLIHYTNHSKMPPSFPSSDFPELICNANPSGIGAAVDLKGLIDEIYISPLAHCYFEDVVKIMADRHGLGDRMRVSTLRGDPVC